MVINFFKNITFVGVLWTCSTFGMEQALNTYIGYGDTPNAMSQLYNNQDVSTVISGSLGNSNVNNNIFDGRTCRCIVFLRNSQGNVQQAMNQFKEAIKQEDIIKYNDETLFIASSTKFISGAGSDSIALNDLIKPEYLPVLKKAYNYTNNIVTAGNQGKVRLNTEAVQELYHTEPKALNLILKNITNNRGDNNILLLSQLPICSCCSKLLLGIFQSHKNDKKFPNVVVISRDQINNFTDDENLRSKLNNLLSPWQQGQNQLLLYSID